MDTEELKKKLLNTITEESKIEEITAAVTIIKTISDIDKAEDDIKKLKLEIPNIERNQKSETLKFYIVTLAPLISLIGVLLTIYFQSKQLKENAQIQRDAIETTEWREFLNNFHNDKLGDDLTTPTSLKSFFSSKRYGKSAREFAVIYMPRMGKQNNFFTPLFSEFIHQTNWGNYKDYVSLLHGLRDIYYEAKANLDYNTSMLKKYYKSGPDPQLENLIMQIRGDSATTQNFLVACLEKTEIVSDTLIRFLRDSASSKPGKELIIIEKCFFQNNDFRNFSFTGMYVKAVDFNYCDFEGANISGMALMSKTRWFKSAWWRAKKIDKTLLDELIRDNPYDPKVTYLNYSNKKRNDAEEYTRDTIRLRSQN